MNKLLDKSTDIYNSLRFEFVCQHDRSGSVGRRYARADEIGVPYCVTVDFEEDGKVTIRDRDSTKQKRVKITELRETLRKLLDKEIMFDDI